MNRILKFLILVAAVMNLVFVFVFDGQIPSSIPLPLFNNEAEREETVPIEAEVQPAAEEAMEAEPEIPAEETGEEAAEEEEEEYVPRCRVISEGGSNVRSGPGTGFDVVTSYPHDTVFILRGEPETGWYPILAEDGTEGYIFESQIEILDDHAEENVPLTEENNQ